MPILQDAIQLALTVLTRAGIGANRWLLNRSASLDSAVWLCGDGRSGTTWLANIINHANEYRFLFEPLHPVLGLAKQPSPEFHYRHPDTEDTEFHELLRTVFLGRASSRFVEMYNKKFFFRNALIKDIYSHLYIKWADVKFPQVKKVVIIRHPLSVAASKHRLKHFTWMTDAQKFLEQKSLMTDFLHPFQDLIAREHSYIENQVLIWSIIHYVLFKQCSQGNIYFLFFEELRHDYENAVIGLFQFLYRKPPDSATLRRLDRARKTPSETSHTGAPSSTALAPMQQLSEQDVENCNYILRRFGLDSLYSSDGKPDRESLARLTGP